MLFAVQILTKDVTGLFRKIFNLNFKMVNIDHFRKSRRIAPTSAFYSHHLTQQTGRFLYSKVKNFDFKLGWRQVCTLRLHGTGHLHAHDGAQGRTGDRTEQGPYPTFQADEGLHCGRERAGCFCGDGITHPVSVSWY